LADYTVSVDIEAKKAIDGINKINKEFQNTAKAVESVEKTSSNMSTKMNKSFSGLATNLTAMSVGFLAVRQAISDVIGAINTFTSASIKMKQALMAVQTVAKNQGQDIDYLNKSIKNLGSDGQVSIASLSNAMKNLLSKGYTTEMATQMLESTKAIAFFSRQGTYDMSTAIERFSEGIKNEMSMLTDSAGATKNLVNIWGDYAKSIGVGANSLSNAQKIQAEYNYFVNEGNKFMQTYKENVNGVMGAQSRFTAELELTKASIGDMLVGFSSGLMNSISNLLPQIRLLLNPMGSLGEATDKLISLNKDYKDVSDILAKSQDNLTEAEKRNLQVRQAQLKTQIVEFTNSYKDATDKLLKNDVWQSISTGSKTELQNALAYRKIWDDVNKIIEGIRDKTIEEKKGLKEIDKIFKEAPKSLLTGQKFNYLGVLNLEKAEETINRIKNDVSKYDITISQFNNNMNTVIDTWVKGIESGATTVEEASKMFADYPEIIKAIRDEYQKSKTAIEGGIGKNKSEIAKSDIVKGDNTNIPKTEKINYIEYLDIELKYNNKDLNEALNELQTEIQKNVEKYGSKEMTLSQVISGYAKVGKSTGLNEDQQKQLDYLQKLYDTELKIKEDINQKELENSKIIEIKTNTYQQYITDVLKDDDNLKHILDKQNEGLKLDDTELKYAKQKSIEYRNIANNIDTKTEKTKEDNELWLNSIKLAKELENIFKQDLIKDYEFILEKHSAGLELSEIEKNTLKEVSKNSYENAMILEKQGITTKEQLKLFSKELSLHKDIEDIFRKEEEALKKQIEYNEKLNKEIDDTLKSYNEINKELEDIQQNQSEGIFEDTFKYVQNNIGGIGGSIQNIIKGQQEYTDTLNETKIKEAEILALKEKYKSELGDIKQIEIELIELRNKDIKTEADAKRIEELTEKLKDYKNEVKTLSSEMDKLNTKSQNALNNMIKAFQDIGDIATKVINKIVDTGDIWEGVETGLQSMVSSIPIVGGLLSGLVDNLITTKAEADKWKKQVEALQNEINNLNKEIANLNNQYSNLGKKINDLVSSKEKEKLNTLNKQLDIYKQQLTYQKDLTKQIETQKDVIDNINKSGYEKNIADAITKLENLQTEGVFNLNVKEDIQALIGAYGQLKETAINRGLDTVDLDTKIASLKGGMLEAEFRTGSLAPQSEQSELISDILTGVDSYTQQNNSELINANNNLWILQDQLANSEIVSSEMRDYLLSLGVNSDTLNNIEATIGEATLLSLQDLKNLQSELYTTLANIDTEIYNVQIEQANLLAEISQKQSELIGKQTALNEIQSKPVNEGVKPGTAIGALGGAALGFAVGGPIGALIGGIGGALFGGLFHDGGVIGSDGLPDRIINNDLKSDEHMIVAKEGERVLTEDQNKVFESIATPDYATETTDNITKENKTENKDKSVYISTVNIYNYEATLQDEDRDSRIQLNRIFSGAE
jgi:hypothetical protein